MIVATPDDMAALGARIAGELRAGDLVMLSGELGAGKTTLTRGIGEALGVRGAITSPTFVLARTHPRARAPMGPAWDSADASELPPLDSVDMHAWLPPLVHVDAYRLGNAMELDDLDIDFAASIVVVEWGAGLLDGVAQSWLEVDIERPRGGDPEAESEPRTVTITGRGPRWQGMDGFDADRD